MQGTASNKLLGVTALLSFTTITAADLQRKRDPGLPSSREWIGLTIVFFMLAAANDLGFTSAGGMAVLVMVAIMVARGDEALQFAGSKVERERRGGRGRNRPRSKRGRTQRQPEGQTIT